MSLVVAKFGGTSVATPERVLSVAKRLVQRKRSGDKVVAVVSAMGKTTDDLIALANQVNTNPPAREMDTLLSTGELVSMAMVAMAIHSQGEEAISLSGRQVGLVTNDVHGKAKIREIHAERIKEALEEDKIVIETSADQVRIEFAKWALSTNETAAAAAKEEAKKAQEAKAKAKAAKKAEKK